MQNKPNKRPLKGFTLVELIIVITILAILATIAFVSFQGYTKNSRDGNRLSTMNSIEKGLEINYVKTGKYPTPESSNGTEILTGGLSLGGSKVTYSYLGVVGDSITRLIGINKTPTDPLSNSRYIYSTTIDGKKYQVASILEGDIGLNLLTKETYADSGYKARVVGNYKMENLYSYLGTSYLIVTPSMIFDTSGSNILNGTGTKFIVNNLSNLPYSPVNGGTVSNDKIGEDIIRDIRGDNQAEILTVTIPSNITSGGDLLNWINTQSNSGIILKSLGAVSSKSGTLVTSANTNTLDKIVGGNTNTSSNNCTLNGTTISNGSSITAYQTSSVPYLNTCVSQTRTCNNGVLSGTYSYTSCTVLPQQWKDLDTNCDIADITIGSQTWAGCNSSLGNGLEWGQTDANMGTSNYNGVIGSCYNYSGNNSGVCTFGTTNMRSNTKANVWYSGTNINGDTEYANIWGKFYTWANSSTACPSGRHVPSSAEWTTLENTLAGSSCRTVTGWDCVGLGWKNNGANTRKFSESLKMPLSGGRYTSGTNYYARGHGVRLWASNQYDANNAYAWGIDWEHNNLENGNRVKTNAFPIRCIKN